MTYLSLFTVAFLAATILPAQSELLLIYNITNNPAAVYWLVAVASAGNVLGSAVNWVLGRYLLKFRHKRWFPANEAQLKHAQKSYHKYGRYSLLLSWVPIIGDPLTVIAGTLREPLWSFIILVTIAKTARYIILAAGSAALS